jgi:hypothetical protein
MRVSAKRAKPHDNAGSSEDAHLSTFKGAQAPQENHEEAHPEHLRQDPHSKAISEHKNAEDAHFNKVSTFDAGAHLSGTWAKPAFEIIPNPPEGIPLRDRYPPNKATIDAVPCRLIKATARRRWNTEQVG